MGDVKLLYLAICDCWIDMQDVVSIGGVMQFPLALCVCRIDMGVALDVVEVGIEDLARWTPLWV